MKKTIDKTGAISFLILALFLTSLAPFFISSCNWRQRPMPVGTRQFSETPECGDPAVMNSEGGLERLLLKAVKESNLDQVICLVGKGADPNAKAEKDGSTAVHWASARSNGDDPKSPPLPSAEILKYLIENSEADIEAETKFFQTPLFWAVLTGHTPAAKILIQKGADIHKKGPSEDAQSPYELVKLKADNGLREGKEILEAMEKAGSEGPVFNTAADTGK